MKIGQKNNQFHPFSIKNIQNLSHPKRCFAGLSARRGPHPRSRGRGPRPGGAAAAAGGVLQRLQVVQLHETWGNGKRPWEKWEVLPRPSKDEIVYFKELWFLLMFLSGFLLTCFVTLDFSNLFHIIYVHLLLPFSVTCCLFLKQLDAPTACTKRPKSSFCRVQASSPKAEARPGGGSMT